MLGPNMNAGMDPANPRAFSAAQTALSLQRKATEREQSSIEALARRYADSVSEDRGASDRAYGEAMGEVATGFPEDPAAASLFAGALMDTAPWDFWERDGSPKPATRTLLATRESGLADDPLANHL